MSHTSYASRTIAADPQAIWALIADFNGLPKIHPGISKSELEAGATQSEPGVVRKLTLPDGFVREKLLKLDAENLELHYAIIDGTMPVKDYVAVIKLTPQGKGSTLAEWWADFTVLEGVDAAAVANGVSQDVFATCLQHIEQTLTT
ncbi:SRPBCC family protein [Erwinia sorbitola]|uniref:SRPBCC family protein n=1 Tax=Erwinia sorbitola TaxID=2681984 RepID=A0A6I6EWV5_9GAMM|nr:SRPBCC family protein [Erwinia sorbitola]QGU86290.1 SRPBCC family protein [Erwinia sorbitola]